MAKRKLQQFAEVETFENVVQFGFHQIEAGLELKGKWRENFFHNGNALILELGCGKGEYTVGLSRRFPDKNFIGVDIKGARIWKGAKTAIAENLNNAGFLRTRIDFIDKCFSEGEVDEIWITFPDPQPREGKAKKRLTAPRFLEKYKRILKQGGIIHLKTDSRLLFDYTMEVAKENNLLVHDATADLYERPEERDEALTSIKTYYEKMFSEKGFKICYLKLSFE